MSAAAPEESDVMPGDVLRDDSGLDWEALRAGGRLHLFCYVRNTVVAFTTGWAVAQVHEVCAAQ